MSGEASDRPPRGRTVPDVTARMREDWDRRAREDAKYYAAFGRRDQNDDEFFATAAPVVHGNLERELRWLQGGAHTGPLRALEIGCGPGRLMFPMSRHFEEIHGVDISEEMVRLASENLRSVPHAHVRSTDGSTLAGFADDSFDFVYSYAVFQHIPSRDVVLSYLREARRVLKAGGVLRCQINGLPESAARYDTWHGVRISGAEIREFARVNDLQLLALEGERTQYMWITARKRPEGWNAERAAAAPAGRVRIRRITNARSSEPVLPCRGRFASLSLWVENLPEVCDLLGLEGTIGPTRQFASYIGPPRGDGLQQVNVALGGPIDTGLAAVQLWWMGEPLSDGKPVRVIPPGPPVPRILSVSDGVDLLSGTRIVSGFIKITIEEAERIEKFEAAIDGKPPGGIDTFCVDPLPPRHEINLALPENIVPGAHCLEMQFGGRRFAPVTIDVTR